MKTRCCIETCSATATVERFVEFPHMPPYPTREVGPVPFCEEHKWVDRNTLEGFHKATITFRQIRNE